MRILLDTHVALWFLLGNGDLSHDARDLIAVYENDVFYSMASVWEIAIKNKIHPDKMPMSEMDFVKYCKDSDFCCLPIQEEHIFEIRTLKRPQNAPEHKDPFDRMLIAQAKTEGMKLLTHDALLPFYNEPCVLYV